MKGGVIDSHAVDAKSSRERGLLWLKTSRRLNWTQMLVPILSFDTLLLIISSANCFFLLSHDYSLFFGSRLHEVPLIVVHCEKRYINL